MAEEEIVESILEAVSRHEGRLAVLAGSHVGATAEGLRAESAAVCESEIQAVAIPEYERVVEEGGTTEAKLHLLVEAQRALARDVAPRLPQVKGRPDDGLYERVVTGLTAATRTVYATLSRSGEAVPPGRLAAHLETLRALRRAKL